VVSGEALLSASDSSNEEKKVLLGRDFFFRKLERAIHIRMWLEDEAQKWC
jgi:hypothetical protein